MAEPARATAAEAPQHQRTARLLTVIILVLTAVVAAGGLFLPGLYRDSPAIIPAIVGQDLVTLLALPLLAWTLPGVGRGSAPATLTWIGLLGYLAYTYTGAAFAYAFNEFFLIYVALFALSIATLIVALTGLDTAALKRQFDAGTPRVPVVIFLALIALILGAAELSQIIPFITSGTLPLPLQQIDTPTFFVYVLDLGVVVPLAVLGALWLRRREGRGYLLAGMMLVKGATMGLALLSMNWFAVRAGLPTDGLIGVYMLIAGGGLGLAIWFFRHCRG